MINQNWVFGKNARVNFATIPPTASPNNSSIDANHPEIFTFEGCASISDANDGKLILYTDGQSVWDANNKAFGTGLKGHKSSTQSAIIVPYPDDPAQYYIVTADGATGNGYSTVPQTPSVSI